MTSSLAWMSRVRRDIAGLLRRPKKQPPSEATTTTTTTTQLDPRHLYDSSVRDQVAYRAPYALLPSVALRPGHVVAGYTSRGRPVLVHRAQQQRHPAEASQGQQEQQQRQQQRQLHAFVNQCRHRGAPLVRPSSTTPRPLKSPRLTCPYHGWTYHAVNGSLLHVPGETEAFGDDLDRSCRGLRPLTCWEKAGWIWIGNDDDGTALSEDALHHDVWKMDDMHGALEPFLYAWDDHAHNNNNKSDDAGVLVGYQEWPRVSANWQLLVETFLESYHVKSLHAKTLHTVTDPTWAMVSEWMDDDTHVRMTVPLRNFQKDDDDDDGDPRSFLGQTTTTHLLFPATSVSLFKRFILFLSIEPVIPSPTPTADGTGSACSRIRAWAFSHPFHDASREDDGSDRRRRDFEAVVAAAQEDWDMAVDIQRGLATRGGGDDDDDDDEEFDFVWGAYETNNVRFLRNVTAAAAAARR